MPLSNSIRMAQAYVGLSTKDEGLGAGLKKAQKDVAKVAASISRTGAFLFAGSAATAVPFAAAIKSASDFQEVLSKTQVVFGDNTDAIRDWADEFSKQVGRSERQVLQFLSSSQDLFVPIGFDEESAAKLSKTLTELAVDLASFNNKADSDVLRDLQAALTGSSETMKKYGVIVNEAAVKQELLNQALDPKSASEAEKAQARLNIILRGSEKAIGDATRTAGSFANQLKALQGTLEDTGRTIGQALLDPSGDVLQVVTQNIRKLEEWAEKNGELIRILAGVTAAVGGLGVALQVAGFALTGYSKLLGIAAAATGLFTKATISATTALYGLRAAAGIAAIIAIDEIVGASDAMLELRDAVEKTKEQFEQLSEIDLSNLDKQIKELQNVVKESNGAPVVAAENIIKRGEQQLKEASTAVRQFEADLDRLYEQRRESPLNLDVASAIGETKRNLEFAKERAERAGVALAKLRVEYVKLRQEQAASNTAPKSTGRITVDDFPKGLPGAQEAFDKQKRDNEAKFREQEALKRLAESAQIAQIEFKSLEERERFEKKIAEERRRLAEEQAKRELEWQEVKFRRIDELQKNQARITASGTFFGGLAAQRFGAPGGGRQSRSAAAVQRRKYNIPDFPGSRSAATVQALANFPDMQQAQNQAAAFQSQFAAVQQGQFQLRQVMQKFGQPNKPGQGPNKNQSQDAKIIIELFRQILEYFNSQLPRQLQNMTKDIIKV